MTARLRALRATALLAGSLVLAARLAVAGETPSLERLLDLVRLAEPSTVAFTERRELQYLTEPIVLEGTLSFSPPDRLTREVHRPKRETMVIEGDLLTLRPNWKDPPTRVLLADFPALDALVTALRAVLAGDAATLARVYEVALAGEEASWTVTLTPRAEGLRSVVRSVVLRGSGGSVGAVEVREAGGDSSLVTIHGPA